MCVASSGERDEKLVGVHTVFFLSVILGSNALYAIGSLQNGYTLSEVLPGLIAKVAIEVVGWFLVAKGRYLGLAILLATWIPTCGLSLYFAFRAKDLSDHVGLLANVLLYVFLAFGVARFCKQRAVGRKQLPAGDHGIV